MRKKRIGPACDRRGFHVINVADAGPLTYLGLNINDHVGATHPEALVQAVKAHRAHLGIALDGDADRLQLVDADGRLYNGDELLYLMAADRLEEQASA